MAILKCKMCGGDLEILPGQTVAECDYCGSRQTVPTADNEKKITLFSRANRLRAACDFDKAAGIYESIVTEFPQEAESYWGLVLCKYGIEYVDDPASGKKIPTCHRSSFDSVMDDNNLELALEYADAVARRVYREEAKQIEQIRKGIIAVSANEEPYDIFICYKETDENGERTLDSVLAQDIYDALTEKKYKVFFARITLEEKLGQEYEPYIFAALNSAKIMLVVGTDYDYFHAVWVKNEWSRYLKLMAADKSRHLIPCYKGIDAYDMPKEFSKLQAQDLGKLGAMQDLMRGVQKLLPKEKQESVRETIHTSANSATAPLLRRMFLFLEEGNWKDADSYAERVLDLNPECAEAYLGKLMAERKVTAKTELEKSTAALKENSNYKNALRFADSTLKSYLQTAAKKIDDRIDNDRKSKIYEAASYVLRSSVDEAQLKQAAADFNGISDYRDAAQQREKCLKKISDMHRADIYAEACSRVGTMRYSNYATSVRIKAAEDAISLLLSIIDYSNCQTMYNECLDRIEELRAQEQMEKEAQENERIYQAGEAILMSTRMITDYLGAAQEYAKIPDYKDAREKREVCLKNHREYVIRSVNDWMELAMDVNRPMQGRMQLLQDSISRLEEEQQYVPEAAQLQDKAHQMIVQLQEQERAEELAREDRRKAERKEKYRKMLQTAKDSEDLNSMREAKVWFEAQGDYQDSKALAKHCASRIVDLEQKALEAEKAAIAERIRQQEIARREAAKKEKKQRMFGIAAVCAAIAAVLLTLLINKIQYQKDFEAAIVLYESGEYQQAADAFGQLDGAEAEEYQSACLDLLEKQQAELAAQKAEAEAKKAEAEAKKAFEATVAEATALEANGDIIGAAMLYGSLTDHPEYMDKSLELWNQFARRKTIAAGNGTTLAVTNQGNVLYTGYTKAGLAQVSKWSGIIAVDAAEHYVLGLCSDGSVMYVGLQNKNPRIAGSWKGIVDIAAGSTYAAGLKADGTVVVTDSSYDVSDWTGIVDVFVGYENVYGLKADGTVVAAGNTSGLSVTHWWDVVEIVCEYEYAVKTHTTYSFAIGVNANGALFYCGKLPPEYEEIKLLTDVQSICVGSRPVVLKKNGTVTYIPGVNSSKYTFDSVRSWRNIVSISSTGTHVIGLRADGTLVASGENDYNQCDVSGWRDIRLP